MANKGTIQINNRDRYFRDGCEQLSLGVVKTGDNQVRVTAWQPGEQSCQLCLYKDGKTVKKISMLSMSVMGMDDIFSVTLTGDNLIGELKEMEYDFQVSGKHRMDPYARLVRGRERFGRKHGRLRGGFVFDDFDWSGEKWVRLDPPEMIMYQLQVRGFTRHSSSGVKNPGTFDGVREKIPYLKKLGVNTLFLLPVYDFDEWMKDGDGRNIDKVNCWGYGAEAFYFAPKSGFSSSPDAGKEFKDLVKALHQNGMNLILDFYFTGQMPCFILQCLRYYVLQYHIDGFHINPNCIDTALLRQDPVLSHVILAGDSWNGTGASPELCGRRIVEMNDGFLVDARRFLKSDEGQVSNFYRRFTEQGRGAASVHYIAGHNGFTLRDMISYDVKHNEANGERNMDGTEYNYSWNCGFEGPTRRKAVLSMRRKQERNALIMLFLGMSIPMLLAGDEFGRSQRGNNNTYCIDNATAWLDWRLSEKNADTFRFVRELIRFRKEHPLYHTKKELLGMDFQGAGAPDVSCHGRKPWVVDRSYYSRELGILYGGSYYGGQSLYFAFNFHWDSHEFYLPHIRGNKEWKILFDTAESGIEEIDNGIYRLAPRSIVVFEEKQETASGGKRTAGKRSHGGKKKRMPGKS